MFFGFLGCREACPIGLDKLTPMLAVIILVTFILAKKITGKV